MHNALRWLVVSTAMLGVVAPGSAWGGHTRQHNNPEEMRDEMMQMHKQIDQLKAQVDQLLGKSVSLAKLAYGVDRRTIRAPFGRFLLIRTDSMAAAVQIVEHTRLRPGSPKWAGPTPHGARYIAFLGEGTSPDLTSSDTRQITGEFTLESRNPADAELHVGDVVLRWREGDWLEIPAGADLRVQMAVSPFVRPEQVRFDSPLLEWMTTARLRSILAGREP